MLPWPTIRDGEAYAAPLEWIDPEDQPDMEVAP
jgi:hypothetical protein